MHAFFKEVLYTNITVTFGAQAPPPTPPPNTVTGVCIEIPVTNLNVRA